MWKARGIGFVLDGDLEVSKTHRFKGKVEKFGLRPIELAGSRGWNGYRAFERIALKLRKEVREGNVGLGAKNVKIKE